MAIETTPLGFQKPDGNEPVRNGDNVIAANGAKAEELHQDARGRLGLIEATNATQDGRLDGVESKNTAQDGRLDSVEAKNATQDGRLGVVEAVSPTASYSKAAVYSITDQDGRRSWLEIAQDGGPSTNAKAILSAELSTPLDNTAPAAVYSITDQDGRRSWLEVAPNGGPTRHAKELMAAAGVGTGVGTVTEVNLAPALASRIPVAFATADAMTDEKRLITVRDPAGLVRPLTSKATQVSFWGDSLFDGWPRGPFNADQSDSLPGVFATQNPGVTVYNGGKQGQSADEIAIRQGGIVPMLTVTGGTIPASGGVTVTTDAVIGWRLDRTIADTTGTLAGIPGTLTRSGSVLTFTRTTAGTATAVAGAVPWEASGRAYAGGVQVILAGRNDVGYTSSAGPVADRVVTATRAMVESLTPTHPRALILGTITATGEIRNSAGWVSVTTINDTLKALYPNLFWDYRAWLVNEAIYALGITPTAGDLANMQNDTLPPSIMVSGDSVHYSPATAAAAAARIKTELTNRGWL